MSEDRTVIAGSNSTIGIGTELNQTYRIDTLLGVGGMGEVFKGHNIQTGDPVAIKIVLPEFARDEMILELFRKEARILNHLSHDAIVRYYVFSIDKSVGRPYLAMEFVDGSSLVERVKSQPITESDFTQLLKRLADGLHKAHEAGVIHRDMSPDNVILPQGLVSKAKIIDFGIARSANVGGETLLGGSFAGKYNYVSPEQLGLYGGEVTPKSDIYSLALVMAAAMRGKPLDMSGSQVEVIEKRRKVPDLTDIPKSLRSVLSAMLQPDPAQRPSDMAEVRDWFENHPADGGKSKRAVERPAAPKKPPGSAGNVTTPSPSQSNALRNAALLIGVLSVIGVGALGGWIFVRNSAPPTPNVAAKPAPTTNGTLEATKTEEAPPTAPSVSPPSPPPVAAEEPSKPVEEVAVNETSPPQPPESVKNTEVAKVEQPPIQDTSTGAETTPPVIAEQLTKQETSPVVETTPPVITQEPPSQETPTATSAQPSTENTAVKTVDVAALGQMVQTFGESNCFLADVKTLSETTAKIDVTAIESSVAAFRQKFVEAAGYSPTIEFKPIVQDQCDIVSAISALKPSRSPIALTVSSDQIRADNLTTRVSGEPISFAVTGIGDRNIYIFLLDHTGAITNISRARPDLLSLKPGQLGGKLTAGWPDEQDPGFKSDFLPMMVVAIASSKPLIAINSQVMFDSQTFVSEALPEVAAGSDVSVAAAYFKLLPP